MKFTSSLLCVVALLIAQQTDAQTENCPAGICNSLGGYGICTEGTAPINYVCTCGKPSGTTTSVNDAACPATDGCKNNPCTRLGAPGFCATSGTDNVDYECNCNGEWLAKNTPCALSTLCKDNKCRASGDHATCADASAAAQCTCSDGTNTANTACPLSTNCKDNTCGANGTCANAAAEAHQCFCNNGTVTTGAMCGSAFALGSKLALAGVAVFALL